MGNRYEIYGAFNDFYNDIPLIKIKHSEGYSVYACKTVEGLRDNKYIFVVVPGNGPLQTSLNNVDWVSFQTRTTTESHKTPTVPIMLNEQRKLALNDILTCTNRTKERSEYFTRELPLKITLVHDPRKNNSLQYPDECRLYQALETYNCVVEMI